MNAKKIAALFFVLTSVGSAHATAMAPREGNSAVLNAAPESTDSDLFANARGGSWNVIYKLVKANVKIWGNVGWQFGRYEAQKKYGVDIGPYPGAKNVTEAFFRSRFK